MSNQKNSEQKNKKLIRVYADGVYDGFHFGHARQLEQAKKKYPNTQLIVGVSGQEETERLKGKTLFNEEERMELIEYCKWVDDIICPCPWHLTTEFLEINNIDYVAHDAIPYTGVGTDDLYGECKRMGKFLETQRTDGISTSDLILNIIRDRELYKIFLLRQGYSFRQLNISVFEMIILRCKYGLKNLYQGWCLKRKRTNLEENNNINKKTN